MAHTFIFGSRRRAVMLLLGLSLGLLLSGASLAQTLYDSSGRNLGRIEGERLYDASGSQIGRIEGERLYSSSGRALGRIDGERIYDASGRQIGRGDGLRRMQLIISFYFFL